MGVVRCRHLVLLIVPSDQHDSEASFISHHASVSFGSICQRYGFDRARTPTEGFGRASSLVSRSSFW